MDETWKHYRKWWKGQSQQPHTVPFHLHVVHREGSRKEAAKGTSQKLSLLVWVTTDVCAQGWEVIKFTYSLLQSILNGELSDMCILP